MIKIHNLILAKILSRVSHKDLIIEGAMPNNSNILKVATHFAVHIQI